MAILRWRPFSELDTFRSGFDKLFDDFYRSYSEGSEDVSSGYPVVDIRETKDDFIISAEMPDVNKEDVNINLSDNTLTIKGEKKKEEEKKGENYHRVERSYGTFQRSFTLPTKVENNKIKANYKDGILVITLPKKDEVKSKEISISVS